MQELMDWLPTLPRPVGLMAAYDARARHVLEGCRELRLRVPDDVALIGVDNDPIMCELANPPLSSVEQGCYRLGYEAAALLDRMMDGLQPAHALPHPPGRFGRPAVNQSAGGRGSPRCRRPATDPPTGL